MLWQFCTCPDLYEMVLRVTQCTEWFYSSFTDILTIRFTHILKKLTVMKQKKCSRISLIRSNTCYLKVKLPLWLSSILLTNDPNSIDCRMNYFRRPQNKEISFTNGKYWRKKTLFILNELSVRLCYSLGAS